MASRPQPSATPTDDCREPSLADPAANCGAAVAAHQRCLAHLTADQLTDYLATLGPGSDIDARGVTFPPGLLSQFLRALGSGGAASVGLADFSEATFLGWALFHRVAFTKRVRFNDAKFAEGAEFYRARFAEDVDFSHTAFARPVRFRRVTFKKADFRNARFTESAEFLARADELVLTDAKVSGELTVEALTRTMKANGLRGEGRLTLRLRAAAVDLTDLVFNGTVTVHALQQPLYFAETSLTDPTTGLPPVRVTSLAGADAGRLVLTDVDLSTCRFAGMHRLDQLFLDGRCVFGRDPRGLRQVLAEEGYWRATRTTRWSPRPAARRWAPPPEDAEVVGPAHLQVMYRQLRKATEDAKNEPGAADFYYGEMEMRRAAAPRVDERLVLWLYWACSGYALRARRALACLLVTIAATTAALTLWGFPATSTDLTSHGSLTTPLGAEPISLTIHQANPITPASARAEHGTEITLDAVIFRGADTQLTTAGHYLDVLARILGPLFLGLSVLAIRNGVKR